MDEKQKESTGPDPMLGAWIKVATNYMEKAVEMWSGIAPISEKEPKGATDRARKSMQSTMKTWSAIISAMRGPGAIEGLYKDVNTMPETVLKMIQTGWDGFFSFHQQLMEKACGIQAATEPYKFENLDQEAFQAWSELYEKEFRQYLKMPQLGLTRYYQERVNMLVDKFNLFQSNTSEFLRILTLPVEKSVNVMQDKIVEMADEGKLPDDPKEYYRMWIKILEGHYMTLFKSSEYTRAMGNALDSLEEFASAKQAILEDVVQFLPVPTNKEMDELCKEVYQLKKRIKTLEKKSRSEK